MSNALRSYPEASRLAVATKRVDPSQNPQGTVRLPNDVMGYGLGTLSARAFLSGKGTAVPEVVADMEMLVLIGSIKPASPKVARMLAEAARAEEE
jgi:hypothetical protein